MTSEYYDSDEVNEASSYSGNEQTQVTEQTQPSQDDVLSKKKFVPSKNPRRKREKMAMKERSKAWSHFVKIDFPLLEMKDGVETVVGTEKRAQCKYCPVHLKSDPRDNGTSSLLKHISLHCKGYPGRNNLEESQQILTSDVLEGTLASKQWSVDACLDAACVMIVLDELPFSTIERPGFKYFCSVAVPRWNPIPCRKQVVKNFLSMYDKKKEALREELRSRSVCLTTDTWTSCQNINYMVITAHFIDDGWKMHKRVLSFCVIPNHSGNSIGKILENCLVEWNLDRVLTVSVDNAAANKVAIEYLVEKMSGWPKPPIFNGKYMHVRCFPHIVNLIVKSGLHIMDKSVSSIRNAVKYVRSSGQRMEAFKKCVETEKVPCKKICVLDVPTRWNSTYMMLDTALELKKAFYRLADEEGGRYKNYFDEDEELDEEEEEAETPNAGKNSRKRVGPPNAADWEKASTFVQFLKVFYEVTVSVSCQLKPTSHKAFNDIVTVKAELDDLFYKPIDSDSSEAEKVLFGMAHKMSSKFRKYFGSVDDINQLFLVALVLDPRYKLNYVALICETMLFMGSDEIKRKTDEVKKLVLDLCDLYAAEKVAAAAPKRKRNVVDNISSASTPRVPITGKRAAMQELWNKQLQGEAVVIGGEVDRYLLDPIEQPPNNDLWDILDRWKCHGPKYPTLQAIARDLLAIQVSTVASESSFSTGKRVIDPHRSSLTPKTVEALICFQNWLKSDAIMGLEFIPTIEEMGWFEEVEKEQVEEEKIRLEKLCMLEETATTTQQSRKVPKSRLSSDVSKSLVPSKPSKASGKKKN